VLCTSNSEAEKELDRTCCAREQLLKLPLEGRMVGKKPRERPRMGMIDDLKEGSYTCQGRAVRLRTNDDDDGNVNLWQ